MACFKTSLKEWQVTIDAPKIKQLRNALNFDIVDDEAFGKLGNDTVLLVDVLWVLCKSQAGGITDEQFGESLVGDPIESAAKALEDARLDFFPARKRLLLRSLCDKQAAVTDAAIDLALTKINNPNLLPSFLKTLETQMDAAMSKFLTGPIGATNSPDAAE